MGNIVLKKAKLCNLNKKKFTRKIILRKVHDDSSIYFLHQNLIMENYNIMCGDELLCKLSGM